MQTHTRTHCEMLWEQERERQKYLSEAKKKKYHTQMLWHRDESERCVYMYRYIAASVKIETSE